MTRSGIDTSAFDPAVRPQDDLYAYVNGRWVAEHVIPADRAMDGSFRALHDQAEEQVRDIIVEAGGAPDASGVQAQIGALYASFMDTDAVEAAGTAPLRPDLDAIAAATTRAGGPFVDRLLGHLEQVGSEDPLVDAVLFCLDELPADRQLSVLFAPGSFNPSVVGEQSLAFTLAVLAELPDHGGVPEDRRDAVVELVVRVLQSLLADPATASRDRAELRRFVGVALAGSR